MSDTPRTDALEPEGGNFYRRHPLMSGPGTFWRCAHGVTGYAADLEEVGCNDCAKALRVENAALQAEVERLTKDRDHWKANAKNQAEIRRVTLTRPDLKERSEYVQKIIAERDALRAKVEELSTLISEATPLVRYFVGRNQRWKNRDGVLQDPHGSHALLEKLEAMQQP